MTEYFKAKYLVLRPMFTRLESINILNFITIWQIRVAKTHSIQGIFRGHYEVMNKDSYIT